MKHTDIERMEWVKNDRQLSGWYRNEARANGTSLRQFVIDNRAEIDHAIDTLTNSGGSYSSVSMEVL